MRNIFKKVDKKHVDINVPKGFEVVGMRSIVRMEPGNVIEGVLKSVEPFNSNKYKTEQTAYIISTSEGDKMIVPGKGFDTMYKESLLPGIAVYVGYKGKRKGSDGNWYKDFAVATREATTDEQIYLNLK